MRGRLTRRNRRIGFTLVELMIVIAIIAIIAALVIPSLVSSRIAANEASAISSLRTVTTVNEHYNIRFSRFAGTLTDLESAGYLDSDLADGDKSGYDFGYVGGNYTFACHADPTDPGQSGHRYFYLDQSGVIRFSTSGAADASGNPLE